MKNKFFDRQIIFRIVWKLLPILCLYMAPFMKNDIPLYVAVLVWIYCVIVRLSAPIRDGDTDGSVYNKGLKVVKFPEIQSCINFSNCDLRNVDLSKRIGLTEDSFSGADLRGAKLPASITFATGLKNVEELSKSAGALFLSMLASSAFMVITLVKTTDGQLISNFGTLTLPVINAIIPQDTFLTIGPIILLMQYIAFHLYLVRLWDSMSRLPSLFQEGTTLDRKTYPWLLNDLVRPYHVRVNEQRPPLGLFTESFFGFVAYYAVPISLFSFWARALCIGNAHFNASIEVICAVGLGLSDLFWSVKTLVLGRNNIKNKDWREPLLNIKNNQRLSVNLNALFRRSKVRTCFYAIRVVIICTLALSFLSVEAYDSKPHNLDETKLFYDGKQIGFKPQGWLPYLFTKTGFNVFPDFDEQDVSAKPSDWKNDGTDKPNRVIGANLRDQKMPYLNAREAFLINAKFSSSILSHANFSGADLRGAKFTRVIRPALRPTDLRDADFTNAHLEGADFSDAWLDGAKFDGAYIADATFTKDPSNIKDWNKLVSALKTANGTVKFHQPTQVPSRDQWQTEYANALDSINIWPITLLGLAIFLFEYISEVIVYTFTLNSTENT